MSSQPPEAADWSRARIEGAAGRACDPDQVRDLLQQAGTPDRRTVQDVLHGAVAMQGLTPAQVAVLATTTTPDLRQLVLEAARKVHLRAYGRRISLVAPICPTNRCVNDCGYCPLRKPNARLRRTSHSAREVQREVVALLDEGYHHVNLVLGDDRSGVPYLRDVVWATYGARSGLRQMQRVDLNCNTLRVSELAALHQAGRIGTYHVSQETYDPAAYAALHGAGLKSDYALRLASHDLAAAAGLTALGVGLLLGAGDWPFDVVALVAHCAHLTADCGVTPRAVTLSRMLPSPGAPLSQEEARQTSDEDLCYVFALARLAMPYADLVLCTPASRETRLQLFALGLSQVSVGSASYPGVYTADGDPEAAGGLTIGRPRGLESLVYRMAEAGYVPNLCVNCHTARHNAASRSAAPTWNCVNDCCQANALLSLKEYMLDYATPKTQTVGARLIQRELARLPEQLRQTTLELMEEADAGMRGVSVPRQSPG